jgi:hypothetical protein
MYLSITYTQSINSTLNAFTGLTKTDIVVLNQLSVFHAGISHSALYGQCCEGHGALSRDLFQRALNKHILSGYIVRKCISKERYFSITAQGRRLLSDFNRHLEMTVQAKMNKYTRLQQID